MECLNIMIIFEKMKGKLGERSSIIKAYERFKKDKRQKFENEVEGKLREIPGMIDSENYEDELKKKKDEYRCMYKYL